MQMLRVLHLFRIKHAGVYAVSDLYLLARIEINKRHNCFLVRALVVPVTAAGLGFFAAYYDV